MRVVFAGTPSFSAECLQALIDSEGIDVVGVMTQPDRKAGRGMKLTPSAVKHRALQHGLHCITPSSLKDNEGDLDWLRQKRVDFLVVVAYGMILPCSWLDAASIAPLNVHASLLPRWRGAAPIERALLAGDEETGICMMRMEEGLDTGPVYCSVTTPIDAATTGALLWQQLESAAVSLLPTALRDIASDQMHAVEQCKDGVSYAKKLTQDDRVIDWNSEVMHIDRQVRCFAPKPGARCRWQGKWLKVLQGSLLPSAQSTLAAGTIANITDGLDMVCANGQVYRLMQLQPEGKKSMGSLDFLRGHKLAVGDVL